MWAESESVCYAQLDAGDVFLVVTVAVEETGDGAVLDEIALLELEGRFVAVAEVFVAIEADTGAVPLRHFEV